MIGHLPGALGEAAVAAVKMGAAVLVLGELIALAVEAEPPAGDPIGHTPAGRAHGGAALAIAVEGLIAQHHAPALAVLQRHLEIAQAGAEADDRRFRSVRRLQADLLDQLALDLTERCDAQDGLPSGVIRAPECRSIVPPLPA